MAGNSKANRQRKPRSKKMVAAPGAVNFNSRLYQHLKLSPTRYTTSFHDMVSLMLNPCCTAFHPYGPRVEACPTPLRISMQGAHLCRNIINANSKVVLGGLEDMQCNIDLSILGYSNHPTFLCLLLTPITGANSEETTNASQGTLASEMCRTLPATSTADPGQE